MDFKEYWQAVNDKKEIPEKIQLSRDQFRKMQKQAFDVGHRSAVNVEFKEESSAIERLWAQFDQTMAQMDGVFKSLFSRSKE